MTRSTMPLLRLRGLTVRYPEAGITALDGLDLDLARGETLALVGESGSGKSQVALAPGYKAPSSQAASNPGAGAYEHRSGMGVLTAAGMAAYSANPLNPV